MFGYHFLDYFFLFFHTVFTMFNIIGWIWKKTRLVNFITLSLTGLSWFGLGIFYGWGFCPLTEWHWHVLEKLGHHNLPYSYIKYMVWRLMGIEVDEHLAETATLVVFIIAFAASLYFNFLRRLFSRMPGK